jgi:hypothetical protein
MNQLIPRKNTYNSSLIVTGISLFPLFVLVITVTHGGKENKPLIEKSTQSVMNELIN